MGYLSFGGVEWGCMTQLFFDNASTLLGVLGAIFNMTFFGVPLDVIDEVGTCFFCAKASSSVSRHTSTVYIHT